MARRRFNSVAGFSMIETIVATGIMTAGLVALAQLFAISTMNNRGARNGSMAAILAQQKMEQLRGLTWGFDTIGLPLSDISTDTAGVLGPSGCPTQIVGSGTGTGLSPSPDNSLGQSSDGFVDYLDAAGCPLGGGTAVRSGAVYVRRWSIEPLPTNPNNTLILQVLVTPNRTRTGTGNVSRMPDEARLISVKTRKTT